jgi:hypothetical protein
MNIKSIIKEQLLLEKKFSEIFANITISFELHHTPTHSKKRQLRHVGEGGDRIYDADIKRTIEKAKNDIVFNIIQEEIYDGERFIIMDADTKLNIVISPEEITPYQWKLYVITTMRKDDFSVGRDQLVIEV